MKDVESWPRKLVVSGSGQGSGEVQGPSVPSRVLSVPSRQRSVPIVQVRTRRRCLQLEGRVVRTSLRCRVVLWFRWIPSELNCSDEGSRFFDRVCDPSKSLLHFLAQRLTRTSPARTSDQDCSSPSPMHLYGGQVDFRYHIHAQ